MAMSWPEDFVLIKCKISFIVNTLNKKYMGEQ